MGNKGKLLNRSPYGYSALVAKKKTRVPDLEDVGQQFGTLLHIIAYCMVAAEGWHFTGYNWH